jgi:hypothetical protein
MRRVFLPLLALLVLVPVVGAAQEKKAAPKPSDAAFNFPKPIQLTDEQKTKVDELKKEYGPKLDEIQTRIDAVMTPERKKTAEEAGKKAKDDGKKGKELQEAIAAALNLPAEDAAKLKEAQADRGKLMKEIQGKKQALLTDDQKAQLKPKPKNDK